MFSCKPMMRVVGLAFSGFGVEGVKVDGSIGREYRV